VNNPSTVFYPKKALTFLTLGGYNGPVWPLRYGYASLQPSHPVINPHPDTRRVPVLEYDDSRWGDIPAVLSKPCHATGDFTHPRPVL
jgi:hypothetical protein